MSKESTEKLVLLVDDEMSLLTGMQAWLRDNQAGYAVMSAGSGKQAMDLIKRHRPDLVISDVRMPGMGGLELLLECRQSYPDTRFILMSAYGLGEHERSSLQRGKVMFLQKPLDLTQLENLITEVLDHKGAYTEKGYLQGISVVGFVQLLHMERQSLCMTVKSPSGMCGELFFEDGELVHAVWGHTEGEQAALALLALEGVEMIINRQRNAAFRTIQKPVNMLVLNAARMKDEKDKMRPS